jgi:NitT/TauT family transport system ATP-binding protein
MSNEAASSKPAHVAVDRVSMLYARDDRDLLAVDDVSIQVPQGQFVSLIGPSGCGKSTLLRIIAGLQPPTSGRALIDGAPPHQAQASKAIGFVFQDASLLPWRTVSGNVSLPLSLNRRPGGSRPEDMIDLVGLSRFRDYYTPQPGRIAADIGIDLSRPRSEEVESEPAFLEYTRELKALLRVRTPA